MGIVTKIKLSAVLAVLVLGFQNCGSKNDFSGDSAKLAAELDKVIKDGDAPITNADDFDVVSYSLNACNKGACTTQHIAFKSKQTIRFHAGALSGQAACNKFGGKYTLTVRPNVGLDLIKIDTLVTTEMACSLLAEEQALYEALNLAYKITDLKKDEVLVYTSLNNKESSQYGTLKLRRKKSVQPPVRLSIVGEYKAISVSQSLCRADTKFDADGPCVIQSTIFKSDQRVNFAANGRVSGRAACNGFGGKYVHTKRANEGTDLLTISDVLSTQMACDLLKEEQALFNAFSDAYKVTVSKEGAVIYLKAGTLNLQRVK